jgi:hypothetical protein
VNDDKRSLREGLDYRIAVRLFDSAFEACKRLPQADQQFLLREVAKRIVEQVLNTRSEGQTAVNVIGIEIKQE